MTQDIFVSYRRSDSSATVGRVIDRLEAQFGKEHIFRDLDSIDYGQDFSAVIHQALERCQVLLVVIGDEWISAANQDGGRRLDDEGDWVRLEVSAALRQGIRVIPVLVEGAEMPSADQLPENLKPLAKRNAALVRDDPDFNGDMERLCDAIGRSLAGRWSHVFARARRPILLAAAAAILVLATIFAFDYWSPEQATGATEADNAKNLEIVDDKTSSVERKSAALVELLKSGMDPESLFRLGYGAEDRHGRGVLELLMPEYARSSEPMESPLGSVDIHGSDLVDDRYRIPGWALDDRKIIGIEVTLDGVVHDAGPQSCTPPTSRIPTACYGYERTDIQAIYTRYPSTLKTGFLFDLPATENQGRKVKLGVRLIDDQSHSMRIFSTDVCFGAKGVARSLDDPSCDR